MNNLNLQSKSGAAPTTPAGFVPLPSDMTYRSLPAVEMPQVEIPVEKSLPNFYLVSQSCGSSLVWVQHKNNLVKFRERTNISTEDIHLLNNNNEHVQGGRLIMVRVRVIVLHFLCTDFVAMYQHDLTSSYMVPS